MRKALTLSPAEIFRVNWKLEISENQRSYTFIKLVTLSRVIVPCLKYRHVIYMLRLGRQLDAILLAIRPDAVQQIFCYLIYFQWDINELKAEGRHDVWGQSSK